MTTDVKLFLWLNGVTILLLVPFRFVSSLSNTLQGDTMSLLWLHILLLVIEVSCSWPFNALLLCWCCVSFQCLLFFGLSLASWIQYVWLLARIGKICYSDLLLHTFWKWWSLPQWLHFLFRAGQSASLAWNLPPQKEQFFAGLLCPCLESALECCRLGHWRGSDWIAEIELSCVTTWSSLAQRDLMAASGLLASARVGMEEPEYLVMAVRTSASVLGFWLQTKLATPSSRAATVKGTICCWSNLHFVYKVARSSTNWRGSCPSSCFIFFNSCIAAKVSLVLEYLKKFVGKFCEALQRVVV